MYIQCNYIVYTHYMTVLVLVVLADIGSHAQLFG